MPSVRGRRERAVSRNERERPNEGERCRKAQEGERRKRYPRDTTICRWQGSLPWTRNQVTSPRPCQYPSLPPPCKFLIPISRCHVPPAEALSVRNPAPSLPQTLHARQISRMTVPTQRKGAATRVFHTVTRDSEKVRLRLAWIHNARHPIWFNWKFNHGLTVELGLLYTQYKTKLRKLEFDFRLSLAYSKPA